MRIHGPHQRPPAGGQSAEAPAALVNHPVMRPAEEHEVWQCGRSALGPVLDVMSVGPLRRAAATIGDATAITVRHRPPRRGRGYPRRPSDLGVELSLTDDPAQC